jgi:glucose-6-phosphate dehydrogenase assembly protein OpcA
MTVAVKPEKILRDLHELWAQLGREQETSGGVLRACAMTLLVVAEDEADAERVRQTLGVLMHDHPSRAIVLRGSTGAALDARVFAECWMPFGRQQQICAEGIELTADLMELSDVAQFLLPLIVPDLPVVLWCRGPRSFAERTFDPLFQLAAKIIFDSSSAPNAKAAISSLRTLHAGGLRVADLAWARLTGWREVLAHLFDNHMPAASSIQSARISYGAPRASTTALYLAAWISRALPSARVTLESGEGDPVLQSVALSGEGVDISITRAHEGSLEVRSGAVQSRSLLPSESDDALMRAELGILVRDEIFEAVLSSR